MTHRPQLALLAAAATLLAGAALAQVPPDIAAQLHAIGPTIDVKVGQIYGPIMPRPPFPDVTASRDIAYGADPLQKLDVFTPAKPGKSRKVIVFVHGGGFVRGDKVQAGTPFNDNVMVWAARHGLVGVNINYRLAPKDPWPAGFQDMSSALAWVRANIGAYGGDPKRIFLWGHSAGANHVADYVAHDELRGGKGPGVAGAVLMSGIYDPMKAPNPYYGDDPAKMAGRASKPGLLKTRTPLMVINAELDPPIMIQSGTALKTDLCAEGRCPAYVMAKDADHLSEGFAIGTADVSVSDPVLAFIKAN